MVFLGSPLWVESGIPKKYQQMSCQEIILEYKKTKNQLLIVYLIKKQDGPQRRLTVIVYNILKESTKVEDFFQDLFLHLSKILIEKDPPNNCPGWFRTVIRNKALNAYGAYKREMPLSTPIKSSDKLQSPEDGYVRKIDNPQKREEMKKAISGIELGWEVMLCRKMEPNSKNCPQKLSISYGQFIGRFQRADKILRRDFGEDYVKYLYDLI